MKNANAISRLFHPLESRQMMSASSGTVVAPPRVAEYAFDDSVCAHRIQVEFNCDVSASLSSANVSLQNTTTRQWVPPEMIDVHYDASHNTATLTFPGFDDGRLQDGAYRFTIDGVCASDGTPMSEPFAAQFVRLTGDVNHDGAVDLTDFTVLASHFNQSGTYADGDVSYDGRVDLTDFTMLAGNFNRHLQPPPNPVDTAAEAAPTFSAKQVSALSDLLD